MDLQNLLKKEKKRNKLILNRLVLVGIKLGLVFIEVKLWVANY